MIRKNLPIDRFRKSSYSEGGNAQCVVTQDTEDGLVAVGDSKDHNLGAFVFPTSAWTSFVAGVKTDAI
jgi:hypothetical protein